MSNKTWLGLTQHFSKTFSPYPSPTLYLLFRRRHFGWDRTVDVWHGGVACARAWQACAGAGACARIHTLARLPLPATAWQHGAHTRARVLRGGARAACCARARRARFPRSFCARWRGMRACARVRALDALRRAAAAALSLLFLILL